MASDSIVLEEEIDPNYEPTEDEVVEYAKWLGMDLEEDKELLWIAREGLKAPLPEHWKPCKTLDTKEIYYFNFSNGESTWDHPCDAYYRNLYEEEKKRLNTKKQAFASKEDANRRKRELDEVRGIVKSQKDSMIDDDVRKRVNELKPRKLGDASVQKGLNSGANLFSAGGLDRDGFRKGFGGLGPLNAKSPLPDISSARRLDSALQGSEESSTSRRQGNEWSEVDSYDSLQAKSYNSGSSAPLRRERRGDKFGQGRQEEFSVEDDTSLSPQDLDSRMSVKSSQRRREQRYQHDHINRSMDEEKEMLEQELHNLRLHYDKLLREMEDKHKTKVDKMKQSFGEELRTLNEVFNEDKEEQRKEHDRELRRIEEELEMEIRHMRKEQDENVKAIRKSHMDDLEREREKCEDEITKLTWDHKKEVKELQAEWDREIERLKAQHRETRGKMDAEVRQLEEDHSSTISKLQKDLQRQEEDLERVQQDTERKREILARERKQLEKESQEVEKSRASLAEQREATVAGEKEDMLREISLSVEEKRRQLARITHELELLKKKHEELKSEHEREQDNLEATRRQNQQERQAMKKRLEDEEASYRAMEKDGQWDVERMEGENKILREKLRQTEQEIEELESDLARKDVQLAQKENLLAENVAELERVEAELTRQAEELERVRSNAHDEHVERKQSSGKDALDVIRLEKEEKAQQVRLLEEKVHVLEEAKAASEAKLSEIRRRHEEERATLQAQQEKLTVKVANLEESCAKADRAVEEERKQTSAERAKRVSLENQLETMSRQLEALRKSLEQGEQSEREVFEEQLELARTQLVKVELELAERQEEVATLQRKLSDALRAGQDDAQLASRLQQQLEDLRNSISAGEKEKELSEESSREELSSLRAELRTERKETETERDRANALETEVAHLLAQIKLKETSLASSESEMQALQSRRTELEEELTQIAAERDNLKNSLRLKEIQLTSAERRLEDAESSLSAMMNSPRSSGAASSSTPNSESLKAVQLRHQQIVDDFQQERDELLSQIQTSCEKELELSRELNRLKGELSSSKRELDSETKKAVALKEDIVFLQGELENANSTAVELRDVNRQLESKLSKAERDARRVYEGEFSKVRSSLEQQCRDLEEKENQSRENAIELAARVDHLESEKRGLQNRLERLSSENSAQRADYRLITEQMRQAEDELASMRRASKDQELKQKTLESRLENLMEERDVLEQKAADLNKDLCEAQERELIASKGSAKLEKELETWKKKSELLESKLESMDRKYRALEELSTQNNISALSTLENEREELEALRAGFEKEKASVHSEKNRVREEQRQLERAKESWEAQKQKIQQEQQALDASKQSLEKERKHLEQERVRLSEEKGTLEADMLKLRARIRSFEERFALLDEQPEKSDVPMPFGHPPGSMLDHGFESEDDFSNSRGTRETAGGATGADFAGQAKFRPIPDRVKYWLQAAPTERAILERTIFLIDKQRHELELQKSMFVEANALGTMNQRGTASQMKSLLHAQLRRIHVTQQDVVEKLNWLRRVLKLFDQVQNAAKAVEDREASNAALQQFDRLYRMFKTSKRFQDRYGRRTHRTEDFLSTTEEVDDEEQADDIDEDGENARSSRDEDGFKSLDADSLDEDPYWSSDGGVDSQGYDMENASYRGNVQGKLRSSKHSARRKRTQSGVGLDSSFLLPQMAAAAAAAAAAATSAGSISRQQHIPTSAPNLHPLSFFPSVVYVDENGQIVGVNSSNRFPFASTQDGFGGRAFGTSKHVSEGFGRNEAPSALSKSFGDPQRSSSPVPFPDASQYQFPDQLNQYQAKWEQQRSIAQQHSAWLANFGKEMQRLSTSPDIVPHGHGGKKAAREKFRVKHRRVNGHGRSATKKRSSMR